MMGGFLSQWPKERPFYEQRIAAALDWLSRVDGDALPTGRHEIDGDRLFALVSEYRTEPKTQRRAEAHRKHIDVQYLVRGVEQIGFAPQQEGLAVLEDCLADRDVIFYADPPEEIELTLQAGMFYVLFPWELHRPNCACDHPAEVKKIVLKIAVE